MMIPNLFVVVVLNSVIAVGLGCSDSGFNGVFFIDHLGIEIKVGPESMLY